MKQSFFGFRMPRRAASTDEGLTRRASSVRGSMSGRGDGAAAGARVGAARDEGATGDCDEATNDVCEDDACDEATKDACEAVAGGAGAGGADDEGRGAGGADDDDCGAEGGGVEGGGAERDGADGCEAAGGAVDESRRRRGSRDDGALVTKSTPSKKPARSARAAARVVPLPSWRRRQRWLRRQPRSEDHERH
jgi:hypothetical protein